MSQELVTWVARDYLRCSGCRRCEIVCSLRHEGWVWPEASMIRVFMLVPGVEIPHLCVQCHDYPCAQSCPTNALSSDKRTGAVLVDKEKCISCSKCIEACPGNIPFLHPKDSKAVICDLCGGDPECVKVCQAANFDALKIVRMQLQSHNRKLFARKPESLTEDVATNLFGEKAEELV